MFGKRIELFKLLGFAVRVDVSWVLIAVLISWSLAAGVFATYYPDLSAQTRWAMGIAGMLGLFASIILHELSHSLAARRFGMSMRGITLFVFGGVAEMDDEPPNAKAEFGMAIAGPLASVAIAGICFGLYAAGERLAWPAAITGVVGWLAWINAVLVVFNLIPAFPLDGGRILRAALWNWTGKLRWATRVTSAIGSGFGIVLIVLGVLSLVGGNFLGGLWWFLIGMFLRSAAQMSYQRLLFRRALEGEPLRQFMHAEPVTVHPLTPLDEFVDGYVYKHHYKLFPVVDDGGLTGCITTRDLRKTPRERWNELKVQDIAQPCTEANTISCDADAMDALSKMNRTGNGRLMVVDHGELAGVLALKDLLNFLSIKLELDDDDETTSSASRFSAQQKEFAGDEWERTQTHHS